VRGIHEREEKDDSHRLDTEQSESLARRTDRVLVEGNEYRAAEIEPLRYPEALPATAYRVRRGQRRIPDVLLEATS
jgi:hypothetical protein